MLHYVKCICYRILYRVFIKAVTQCKYTVDVTEYENPVCNEKKTPKKNKTQKL